MLKLEKRIYGKLTNNLLKIFITTTYGLIGLVYKNNEKGLTYMLFPGCPLTSSTISVTMSFTSLSKAFLAKDWKIVTWYENMNIPSFKQSVKRSIAFAIRESIASIWQSDTKEEASIRFLTMMLCSRERCSKNKWSISKNLQSPSDFYLLDKECIYNVS